MNDNSKSDRLFEEFPVTTTDQWEQQIITDLKGADYEKKLTWRSSDGISVRPYFRREDLETLNHVDNQSGEFPYLKSIKYDLNSWEIRQNFTVTDPEKSNKEMLDALNKGATSLGLDLKDQRDVTRDFFGKLLSGIDLETVPVHLAAGNNVGELFLSFTSYLKENNVALANIKGSVIFNPLARLSITGNYYNSESSDHQLLAKHVKEMSELLHDCKATEVDGSVFRNAGGTAVQELAYALSIGSEYINMLVSEDISVDQASGSMTFKFGTGSNYFIEIAKLRAARFLWAKIVEAFHPESKSSGNMYIHSENTLWNKTLFDPHVNILRSTTEAMSASLGGADSISVNAFDTCYQDETELSSRIARNTQIILQKEAYFDKVIDPAAGSYYIEQITHSLIEEAWKLFLDVEENGGYVECFKKGMIQKEIRNVAEKRLKNIAGKREILLGTNQYPNIDEKTKEIVKNIAESDTDKGKEVIAEPLKLMRGGENIEKLRMRTEKANRKPKVFMLTYGNPVMRKARSAFSTNFFACAGFEIIDNIGFKSIKEGVSEAMAARADIVVACSSDEEYESIVPEIKNSIKDKAILVVAGLPACTDMLKEQGVENFIHVKSDLLNELTKYQDLLNI